MLGSRTKQIYSYGKRSQRIVNVSEERSMPKEAGSIFDDLEPAQWAPIASRMKKRENNIPCKPRTPSPRVIRMNRKKRLSPVLPSGKKQHRLAQIMDAEATKRESSSTNGMTKASSSKAALDTASIPPRTPFSHFHLNVPGSPAIPAGRSPPVMGPSLKRNKPFSPFIDMDIIILDENGKAVKQERRVSRTDVEVNPFNHGNADKLKGPLTQGKPGRHPTDTADSDLDLIEQSKKPKRLARRAPLIVYSDDSESDGDSAPIPQAHKTATALRSLLNRGVRAESSRIVNSIHPTKTAIKAASSHPVLPQALPAPATSYQPLPSPPLRPRQLTPIRGSHGRHLFEPPSPPSPACTDLDFSLEFEELTLASLSHVDTSCRSEPEHPTYLRPLLEECHQDKCGPIEFSSFIDTFPFDPVVQSEDGKPTGATFKKVGEASYSEVFGIGDVVLKVIPLRDESSDEASTSKLKMNVKHNDSGEVEDGPAPSDAKDVRKEIIVTRAMGEVCDGFVKLLKTYIVRGKYPEVLLGLWDEYHKSKGSESVRPDSFLVSQTYAIIVLPNGGLDLEAYKFVNASKMGWRQSCSLFWQVAKALTHAEQLVSFEHRDLHWGQILVKNVSIPDTSPLKPLNQNQSKQLSARLPMDDLAHGVRGTLIDLGLSRMDAGDGAGGERVHWTPFDDEIFMGEGDYQFDVYRMMREYSGGAWEDFNPLTNVMWLHYLALKLLHSKRLKPPAISRKARTPEAPPSPTAAFTERDCYHCLLDIESWLGNCVSALAPPAKPKPVRKGRGGRKIQAPVLAKAQISAGPSCAGEIVAYAVKKGWVQPMS